MIVALVLVPPILFALALASNLYREHRQYKIQLKPNCLLTRKPVVFVTGLRSVFYFRKYWNAYPEILAEHGYEVFTLHLPWQNARDRYEKLQAFLSSHTQAGQRYHFIVDEHAQDEFTELWTTSDAVASLSVLKADSSEKNRSSNWFLKLIFQLHRWKCPGTQVKASDLGVHFPTAAAKLLQRVQALGEQDFVG